VKILLGNGRKSGKGEIKDTEKDTPWKIAELSDPASSRRKSRSYSLTFKRRKGKHRIKKEKKAEKPSSEGGILNMEGGSNTFTCGEGGG